ncbi:MAG TPA: hypothetical protein DDY21_01980 [Candidatus Moranbacteria bacterium]|nr:hypothetical protein [Candidatus Moranbacteria bacterium]
MVSNNLESDLREILHSIIIGLCLDGECYAFAIAMHRCLSWPMIGLMQGELIRHAGVVDPDGNIWDCRGKVGEKEFGEPFLDIKFPYETRPITEEQLKVVAPLLSNREPFIESLSKKAQMVWPELPWKSDTLVVRVRAFAEELEALSRKHSLWIYGNLPTALPAIAEGDGEEKGYALKAVMGGYMINRSFQS